MDNVCVLVESVQFSILPIFQYLNKIEKISLLPSMYLLLFVPSSLGFVIGADIDYMMIHAKSRPSRITQKQREKDESIRANLEQYNCADRYVDVIVSDFSNPIWNDRIRFDSIITDRENSPCFQGLCSQ